ncbi:MAG: hypothetical protein JNN27_00480 [Planctomycetes bacterium]|nr:hypothetical protein [Planctomycetota bacterium]
MRFQKNSPSDERGAIFAPEHLSKRKRAPEERVAEGLDLDKLQQQFLSQSSESLRQGLAIRLGVTVASLADVGLGWAKRADLIKLKANGDAWPGNRPRFAFSFPEYDEQRRIVGFSLRAEDGRKGSPSGRSGCRRGLIIPTSFDTATGPVLVVEGASDVAALSVLGLRGVGRPSNTGGGEMLAVLLRDVEDVVIVGENDKKPNGSHPGREGMQKIASHLASAWSRPVRRALPPSDCKDVREWLAAKTEGGLDIEDRGACVAASRELLELLEAEAERVDSQVDEHDADAAPHAPADPRPEVHILAGKLPQAAEHTERLISEGDSRQPRIFQRQGTLVRTVRLEKASKGRIELERGATVIRDADEPYILDQAARVARFIRYNKKGDPYPAHPPAELARAIQSHAGSWPFPLLAGVVEAPQLFEDGRILELEGYDAASGLVLRTRGVAFAPIAASPTREDARRALRWLDEQLLAGFPFVAECDRAAGLSFVLGAVGRSTYAQGPACGATAPNRSCGKSTLLRLGAVLATGRGPALIDPGSNDEEADKRILSVLVEGHRFVSFDNLRNAEQLDTPSIAKAITEPVYTGRPLGKTGTISLPTDGVLFTYSGVNLEPRGDTVSRSVLIRLDPAVERPWAKRWETRDPTEIALERRGELVAAALTVLKAFIDAGCPDQGLSPYRLAGWNRVIRNAVVWAGYADPLAGMTQLEAGDPENEPCADLMAAWSRVFGERVVTASEVVAACNGANDDLKQALLVVAASGRTTDAVEPRRLGKFLARYERRVVGGLRFMRLGESGTRARWALQAVEPARSLTVSAVPPTPYHAGAGEGVHVPAHDARACARDIEQGDENCGNRQTASATGSDRGSATHDASGEAQTAGHGGARTAIEDGGVFRSASVPEDGLSARVCPRCGEASLFQSPSGIGGCAICDGAGMGDPEGGAA